MQTSQIHFWECFCSFRCIYPVSNEILRGVQISTCRFYKKCVSNLSNQRTFQHCALNTNVTKKVLRMLQFSYVRFFPFPTKSSEGSNYPLAVSTKRVFQPWTIKEWFNTVSWMQTSRRRFWECYCLAFTWSYFLYYHGPPSGPYLHLQILQKESFQTALSKGMFHSVTWMQSSQSSFWECFYLVSTGRYFLFHHRPQSPPNVHLQILEKECFKASLS